MIKTKSIVVFNKARVFHFKFDLEILTSVLPLKGLLWPPALAQTYLHCEGVCVFLSSPPRQKTKKQKTDKQTNKQTNNKQTKNKQTKTNKQQQKNPAKIKLVSEEV